MSSDSLVVTNKRVLISILGDLDGSVAREIKVLHNVGLISGTVSIVSLDPLETPLILEKKKNPNIETSCTVTWPKIPS